MTSVRPEIRTKHRASTVLIDDQSRLTSYNLTMAESKNLKLLLQPLIREFSPNKIYLFGSQARGDANKDSDYDLLLVVEDSTLTPLQRMERAHALLWHSDAPAADIFILTAKEFEASAKDFGSIAESAVAEGRELVVDHFT